MKASANIQYGSILPLSKKNGYNLFVSGVHFFLVSGLFSVMGIPGSAQIFSIFPFLAFFPFLFSPSFLSLLHNLGTVDDLTVERQLIVR